MKKNLIAILPIAIGMAFTACDGGREGSFELKGKFTDGNGEVIYLEKLVNPQPVLVDSTSIDEDGNFEFKNYTPKIGFYRIKTTQDNFAMLVLDSADKVTVTGSMKDLGRTYKVEGSPETTLFMEFNTMAQGFKFQQDSLKVAFQNAMATVKMDSLRMDSISGVFQPYYEDMMDRFSRTISVLVEKNPSMYTSLMLIQQLDPEKYSPLFKQVSENLIKKYPNDKVVKTMHDNVTKLLALSAGQTAPEFSMPTPEGKELSVSSFRGKLLLLDFWASWCGPCRREMPSVVKVYSKYKDKGLEILGVSLDQDRDKWLQALKTDGMVWPQVSDLKYWNSPVVRLYNIEGIPFTVLVDREGKIIAKGLRGAELEKAIENYLAGGGPKAGS